MSVLDALTENSFNEGGSTGGILILTQDDRVARIIVDPFTGRISSEEVDEAI